MLPFHVLLLIVMVLGAQRAADSDLITLKQFIAALFLAHAVLHDIAPAFHRRFVGPDNCNVKY